MQNELNPERVAQLAEEVLANFGALHSENGKAKHEQLTDFATSSAITFSDAQFYLVLGALNFPKLDDGRIMFAGITPALAAKLLKSTQKKMRRVLVILTEKGLLARDVDGSYKIADIDMWFGLSKSTTLSA